MTNRHTADTINDDDLDELYDRLATAQDEARRWLAFIERGHLQHMSFGLIQPDGSTEQLACADWCHVCRTDRTQTALREVLDAFEAYWAHASYCGPDTSAVKPEDFQAWRATLNDTQES